MAFFGHVDGVLWNLYDKVPVVDNRLAGKPGIRFQPPGLVQQVFLALFGRVQCVVTLAHDDMASGAGADLVAGMIDINIMIEQVVADGHAFFGFKCCAVRAEFYVW